MAKRSDVVSSFTIVKGALIEETYDAFIAWDETKSKKANLDRLKAENTIRATSENWSMNVAKALNRRFEPSGRDRALVKLAKARVRPEVFNPILLWHITRDEFLVRDFLLHFLFPLYVNGAHRVDSAEAAQFVSSARSRGGRTEHKWAPSTLERVVIGLLKAATDFGLLRGSVHREIVSYHLPDDAFLYLLHAIHAVEQNAIRTMASEEWRMYYMSPEDVQRELFRLHQFRRIDFQIAGSLAQLSLPCSSAAEYAERMVS
jgi:BrxA